MPSSFARPGPRPGASVVAARLATLALLLPAGGCAVLGRAPPPRFGAAPSRLSPSRAPGPRFPGCARVPPPAVGRSWACRLCRSLRSLGDCSRGSPRASGGLVFPPPHLAKFFCAPVRKLVKIRPQKTAKDPRKSGVFSSLDNIGGNCRAFLHEVAPSYPQEKFRFFAKKQDTPCKDCFSVLLSEW